jgi:hypothetical protein
MRSLFDRSLSHKEGHGHDGDGAHGHDGH